MIGRTFCTCGCAHVSTVLLVGCWKCVWDASRHIIAFNVCAHHAVFIVCFVLCLVVQLLGAVVVRVAARVAAPREHPGAVGPQLVRVLFSRFFLKHSYPSPLVLHGGSTGHVHQRTRWVSAETAFSSCICCHVLIPCVPSPHALRWGSRMACAVKRLNDRIIHERFRIHSARTFPFPRAGLNTTTLGVSMLAPCAASMCI